MRAGRLLPLALALLQCTAEELQYPVLTHRIFAGPDCSGEYVDVIMEANKCVKYEFPKCVSPSWGGLASTDQSNSFCAGGNMMPDESVYMKGVCDENGAIGAQYMDPECTTLMPHVMGESITTVVRYPSECLQGFTRLMSCQGQGMQSFRERTQQQSGTCSEAAGLQAENKRLSEELVTAKTREAEATGKLDGLEGQVRILTDQVDWMRKLISAQTAGMREAA